MVNVDFADVKAIMHCAGNSLMSHGVGTGSAGKGRAVAAAKAVIASPLLECGIHDATGVVWNITGPPDMALSEISAAADIIHECVDPMANIIFGAVVDDSLKNEVRNLFRFHLTSKRLRIIKKKILCTQRHAWTAHHSVTFSTGTKS